MGYYSTFKLSVYTPGVYITDAQVLASVLNEGDWSGFSVDDDVASNEEPFKWYEHDEDLQKIVDTNDGLIIQLDRFGEEAGDVERSWYRGGHPIINQVMTWPAIPDFK